MYLSSNYKYICRCKLFFLVILSRIAHGPAIQMIILQQGEHQISTDVTPTLACDVPVSSNGWPRPDTFLAFPQQLINNVVDIGCHLVPKGDTFWYVSYSKAETELLRGIDFDDGCRKMCHQFLKRCFDEYRSTSEEGAKGISSYILKVC